MLYQRLNILCFVIIVKLAGEIEGYFRGDVFGWGIPGFSLLAKFSSGYGHLLSFSRRRVTKIGSWHGVVVTYYVKCDKYCQAEYLFVTVTCFRAALI